MKIGIDAGGTLTKIVIEKEGERSYQSRLTTELDDIAVWLNQQDCDCIHLTGGNSKELAKRLNCETVSFVEFDAAHKGLEILLKEQDIKLDTYIFTNVGTGTSIHLANTHEQKRVGGIGTGGGMIQGLGYLLTHIKDYQKLTDLAQQGDRECIDLKVKHIYKNSKPPISGELTAANFGHVLHNLDCDFSDADKLASMVGVVGESITTVSIHNAREFKTEDVVYIGSSFYNNPLLREVIENYTRLRGFNPHYVENGAYSGALGSIYLS
ncbi:type II pantothenate kinase [Staphylococcus massiliensis]|uniref:Pantothenate kinase n=1 Tax=Staphylococcus massiliensis S46 TaxID=1229783 RepID=K9AIM0_9STAP|nr:type II pantothenate kinase [Staphylococcus massiliensis]EKU47188.1 pantothenate kinase [Staphylococcus massiliensis S46]MCG3400194.1 type II pantothenate kinase [Staphylococcus massiliensis]MCG3402761.1 type II pantothenate kinase [Staphylococcus massiliensis]MCG3413247.1 type II pantothenate kinase [Staphylococcus massiliensis]PNZ99838.1 type II pantothenate kinase [Staphylococcus massiliensis CCUG 55927]